MFHLHLKARHLITSCWKQAGQHLNTNQLPLTLNSKGGYFENQHYERWPWRLRTGNHLPPRQTVQFDTLVQRLLTH